MKLLTSKQVIADYFDKLKSECLALRVKGVLPTLHVILVGEHGPSVIYTNNKQKFAQKIGAHCEIIRLDKNCSEEELLNTIDTSVNDPQVHGIIVQLPLPQHLSHLASSLGSLIPPQKDIDGFTPTNLFKLLSGDKGDHALIPCTPKGILTLLHYYEIPIEGRDIVVIGRSLIVGKPLSQLLENYNATLTLCHLKTKNIQKYTREADIIMIAAGDPKFFGPDYFRNDQTQIVIDIGINKDQNGKLCGDVDFERVAPMVKAITPVPGGIGPMTIFSLIQNLLLAAKKSVL